MATTTAPVTPTVLAPTPVHAAPISEVAVTETQPRPARGEAHPTTRPQSAVIDVEPSTKDPLRTMNNAGTMHTLSLTATSSESPSTGTDRYALLLVSKLRHIAHRLPDWIPEGAEGDMMARFRDGWPVPDDPRDAWESFDPFLNAMLGWGRTAEEVARDVRRGAMGMDGLVVGLEHCVVEYKTGGGLLETKMSTLFKAVEIA